MGFIYMITNKYYNGERSSESIRKILKFHVKKVYNVKP